MKHRWLFISFVVILTLVIPFSPRNLRAEDVIPNATPPATTVEVSDIATPPQGVSVGTVGSEENTDDEESVDAVDGAAEAAKAGVTIGSIRTSETNGKAKKVFSPGETIRYMANIKNTTGRTASVYVVWMRNGPCGSTVIWATTLQTGLGTWMWWIDSAAPANCPGTYQYKLSVSYNGKTTSKTASFTVKNDSTISCPTITNWKGEYWNNPYLSGTPVLCRDDYNVSFDWDTGSPNKLVPQDQFSARWTRALYFSGGLYRFHLRGDDGIRLWVDSNLLIDQWHDQVATEYTADWNLSGGNHNLSVEYYENGGGASVALWWEWLDAPNENLALGRPAYATSQQGSGYEAYHGNDGNGATRWSSAVNLGEEWWWTDVNYETFERVVIDWETAYAAQYFVGWSDDGINFTGYWYTLGNAQTTIHDIGTHTNRYVGVAMRQYAPCCGNYSFYELQVWRRAAAANVTSANGEAEAVTVLPDSDLVTITMTQPSRQIQLFLPMIAR